MEISSSTIKTNTLFFRPNPTPLSLSNRQIQLSIKCARKKTRSGSVRSAALILHSTYLIASKLRLIPEPLDFAIREFAGGNGNGNGNGNGGGFGFGKHFGWGGSRWNKRKLGFLWMLMGACGLGLWLILGKEIDSEIFRAVLGLYLFGVSISGWKMGFKDWALGFSSCAFLVGLGVNKRNFQSWIKDFVRGKRRRGMWQWRL